MKGKNTRAYSFTIPSLRTDRIKVFYFQLFIKNNGDEGGGQLGSNKPIYSHPSGRFDCYCFLLSFHARCLLKTCGNKKKKKLLVKIRSIGGMPPKRIHKTYYIR